MKLEKISRTAVDCMLLNSIATNYPTTYKGKDVIEILIMLFDSFEAQLKDKKEEIELLKQCVDEAIKRPMGVEPSIYSDYKSSHS